MIVCGDVSHNFWCGTEAGGSVFVALNTLQDKGNLDCHIPANGSGYIKKIIKKKCVRIFIIFSLIERWKVDFILL